MPIYGTLGQHLVNMQDLHSVLRLLLAGKLCQFMEHWVGEYISVHLRLDNKQVTINLAADDSYGFIFLYRLQMFRNHYINSIIVLFSFRERNTFVIFIH